MKREINLLLSKYYFDEQEYAKSFSCFEKVMGYFDELYSSSIDLNLPENRIKMLDKIRNLPELRYETGEFLSIKNWIKDYNKSKIIINKHQMELSDNFTNKTKSVNAFIKQFTQRDYKCKLYEEDIKNIFSVKGSTYDSVMIVLTKKAGKGRSYASYLKEDDFGNEEMRIFYVGISRARQNLWVVVDSESYPMFENKIMGVVKSDKN